MNENKEIYLTTGQMTALFGVTKQGLGKWTERGMPKKGRNEYSLKDCLEWIKREVWFVGVGKGDLAEEKLKFQKARTRREELHVQQEEKSLIPKSEAVKWVSLFLIEIKQAIWTLPRRFAAELATLTDGKEIELLLQQEVRRILTILAEGKKKGMRNEKTQS